MSFSSQLANGDLGIRLALPEGAEVTAEGAGNIHLIDSQTGVAWWFFHFPDLRMDLSAPNRDDLLRALEWPARVMFDDIHRQQADDNDRPPRTADPGWSPMVEAEFVSLSGTTALRTIHRMAYAPTNEMIMGHVLVPLATGLFEARALSREESATGMRESALTLLQMTDEGTDDAEPPMPPQSYFDDEKHDERFSEHPLSRLRAALRWLVGPDGLEPLEAASPFPKDTRVQLSEIGCSFKPLRFMNPAADSLHRVMFCGTDGVQHLVVEPLRDARSVERAARRHARSLHQREQVRDIELHVDTGGSSPDQSTVVVTVTGTGHQGPLQNTMAYFRAGNAIWSLGLTATRGFPRDQIAAELRAVAASFEAEPRPRQRWLGLF